MKELYTGHQRMPGLDNTEGTAYKKNDASDAENFSDKTESTDILSAGCEAFSLEPEVRYDVPGCREALVTGNPFQPRLDLCYRQGDNPYNASGNCGLMSIINTLRRSGIDVSEAEITKKAIDNGLCQYNPNGKPSDNGGTTAISRQGMLKLLHIDSDIRTPKAGGKLEDIADAVDCGKGVLISGNAGVLWNCDDGSTFINGRLVSNHCVAVTGVARDAYTGKIVGIYICDSGRGIPSDACRFLSVEEFHDFYTDVHGSCANITKKPITEV